MRESMLKDQKYDFVLSIWIQFDVIIVLGSI